MAERNPIKALPFRERWHYGWGQARRYKQLYLMLAPYMLCFTLFKSSSLAKSIFHAH